MELYLYTLPIVLAGLLQGGYFVYTSAILNAVMLIGIIVCVMKNKKVYLAFNMNLLSIFIVCLMYFLTALWGIDSGMSLMGGVKFLPLLLWFLLIAGKKDRKERLIETLPVLGACMTLFSFVMMQFSIFEKSVSVAGRLAGFFQYPNTYALFMLICLVIAVDKLNWDKIDWLWCAYAGIAVFGIIMSGSRTVLLLMLVLGAWYCVKKETAGEGSSDGGRRMCGVGRSSMDHRSGKRGADQGVQHEWQYILGTITVHEGCGRNDSDTSVRTGILWISLSADLLSDRCIIQL